MWYRVFGLAPTLVSPAALAAHLHAVGRPVVPHFKGDDLGWTDGELHLPGTQTPIYLSRYLTTEDNLRPDLNAYAAELETMTYSPASGPLMARVISTQQLITIRKPLAAADEAAVNDICERSAQFLAAGCDGVYQTDGAGWFAADGTVIVAEY